MSKKSARSTKTRDELMAETGNVDGDLNFSEDVQAAVNLYDCPISVAVYKMNVSKEFESNKKLSRGKNLTIEEEGKENAEKNESLKELTSDLNGGDTIVVTEVHDSYDNLVEILINTFRCRKIPRHLMQILCVILPKYRRLSKFTINNSRVDGLAIYELHNILLATKITEVSFDSISLAEGNYYSLLEQATCLRHLSIRRCNVNDDVCLAIAQKMHHLQPGENILSLNLSSNRVTDVGAKYIGEFLRNNRQLRYLNLADNQISDEGAGIILDVLKEFPLTTEEVYTKRKLRIEYLKKLNELYKECLQNMRQTFTNQSVDKKSKKKTSASLTATAKKVELRDMELLGPFVHPFADIVVKDEQPYCKGNLTLCYLNLGYNNLSYFSIVKLLKVVEYQQIVKDEVNCGLIRVIIDGNNLPCQCEELTSINTILSVRPVTTASQSKGAKTNRERNK